VARARGLRGPRLDPDAEHQHHHRLPLAGALQPPALRGPRHRQPGGRRPDPGRAPVRDAAVVPARGRDRHPHPGRRVLRPRGPDGLVARHPPRLLRQRRRRPGRRVPLERGRRARDHRPRHLPLHPPLRLRRPARRAAHDPRRRRRRHRAGERPRRGAGHPRPAGVRPPAPDPRRDRRDQLQRGRPGHRRRRGRLLRPDVRREGVLLRHVGLPRERGAPAAPRAGPLPVRRLARRRPPDEPPARVRRRGAADPGVPQRGRLHRDERVARAEVVRLPGQLPPRLPRRVVRQGLPPDRARGRDGDPRGHGGDDGGERVPQPPRGPGEAPVLPQQRPAQQRQPDPGARGVHRGDRRLRARPGQPHPAVRGTPVALIYYGTSFNAAVVGFPLFFMVEEDVSAFADAVLARIGPDAR
jgi:hypothetical protein